MAISSSIEWQLHTQSVCGLMKSNDLENMMQPILQNSGMNANCCDNIVPAILYFKGRKLKHVLFMEKKFWAWIYVFLTYFSFFIILRFKIKDIFDKILLQKLFI